MLIRRPGQSWHALGDNAVHDERALQTLLAQSPGLLPSGNSGELVVAANFRLTASGSLDLLGVGADGKIVLVECGRQDGPGRRPMGGPALATAAGLWRMPFTDFDAAFSARAGVSVVEAVKTISGAAGARFDEAMFKEALTANLTEGRFQLILAVDTVSDEVRRVVSYLNSGARPGLTAVALGLRYLAEDGIEILFPTVFAGEGLEAPLIPALGTAPADVPVAARPVVSAAAASTPTPGPAPAQAKAAPAPAAAPAPPPPPAAASAAQTSAPSPGPTAALPGAPVLDVAQREAALFSALEAACLPAAVSAVRSLYAQANRSAKELQWGQGEHPAVTAVYNVGGASVGVWSCYTDLKPSFVVNFEWLVPHLSTERLERLAEKLGQLPSVSERLTGLAEAGYRRRLALAVNAVLAQPGAAEVIGGAVDELVSGSGSDSISSPGGGRRKG